MTWYNIVLIFAIAGGILLDLGSLSLDEGTPHTMVSGDQHSYQWK